MVKASLYSFITFLSGTALIAIVSILSGDIGEFELKTLCTTSVVALASICALCCGAYYGRTGHYFPALAGSVLAVLSALLIINGVWIEISIFKDAYWKLSFILLIFAIGFAHSLALLMIRLPPSHSWLRIMTTATIFLLALVISGMIISEFDDDFGFKTIGVLSVLVSLQTLVIPILGRINRIKPQVGSQKTETCCEEELNLARTKDGLYVDGNGNLYKVTQVQKK